MTRVIKLEMKGFKSFAQKTDIVFSDDFNVILGPNGSGKSNVLDALCFVLAKSSAKGLRAEKSANLIYNGGKTKKAAKEGEVSIYFDNTKRVFPVAEDVVKVTRIIKDSGQSVYKINEQKHTRNEIIELLTTARISADGYNIILQGDIIRFVEMSSVERRQIIEEVAGIGVYEEKRLKAQHELEKVESGLNDARIILHERENYLKELKNERDQALSFKELQTSLLQHKATVIHVGLQKKKIDLEAIEQKTQQCATHIEQLQQEIDVKKQEVVGYKQQIDAINKKIEEQGEKEQVALHKEVEQLKVTIGVQEQRLVDVHKELEKIQMRKQQLEENKKDMQAKIKDVLVEQKSCEQSMKQNTLLQQEITQKITTFKKKHHMEDSSGLDEQMHKLDTDIDAMTQELQELRAHQQDVIREQDRLAVQIEHMDEKITAIEQLHKEHAGELKALQQKRTEFKKATVELSQCLTDDTTLSAQVSNAKSKYNALQDSTARLHAKNAAILEQMGGDIATKKILEQRKSGVIGTVGSLASVESKYALALEVAAGARLKSIVVDTDKTASECIQFLREQKLGVATFLPLNKIKTIPADPHLKRVLDSKGVLGLAVDVVDYDTKYKSIFSHVFGHTVVVESLDVARRLGVGTARMVTLQGDLVEKSGSMRGGFLQVKGKSSSFMEKELSKDLQDMERQLAQQQTLIDRLVAKKEDNEQRIVRLRALKATLEGDIIKTEKSLHIDSNDLDVSWQLKKEFQQKLKDVDKQAQEAQMVISKKSQALLQLKTQKQDIRNQLIDVRNPAKLAELNTFQDKLQQLQQETMQLQAKVQTFQSQISTVYEPEIENMLKIIKQIDKEHDQFKEEQKTLKATLQEHKKNLAVKEEKEKAFYAQFQAAFAQRNTLQEQVHKAEQYIINKEEQIRSVEHKNNAYFVERARIKAEHDAHVQEFEQYTDVELLQQDDISQLKRAITVLEQKISALGNVNMKALEVYEKVYREYEKLLEKRDKLSREKDLIYEMMNEIETRKKELFLKMFEMINTHFKKIFMTLTQKGEAFLELEDPQQPFEAGVKVKVRLSGTKFLDIRSLSGGEKTLTALAFIFAIQENNPASFYILDEVDAALDKRNAERLGALISAYCAKAQYIVISHNDGVIRSAKNLYGVSMNEHGMSKVISLKV
ncbi:MAG: chromosome segregation protein SMC [Candidatus Woesearchaeota archaeon]